MFLKRKTWLLGLAAMLLASNQASAVDPYEGSTAGYDWSGFYVGAAANRNWTDLDLKGSVASPDFLLRDFKFGGFAGANISSGPFVFGLEGSVNKIGLAETKTIGVLGAVIASSDWSGGAALRAGYALDSLLLFAKGGAALTNVKLNSSLGGSANETRVGLLLGVGADYALSENIVLRAEFERYMFRGDATLAGVKNDYDLVENVARVGVAFKF